MVFARISVHHTEDNWESIALNENLGPDIVKIIEKIFTKVLLEFDKYCQRIFKTLTSFQDLCEEDLSGNWL